MKRFIISGLSLIITSCASTKVQKLSDVTYPPKAKDCAIEAFASDSKIGKKNKEFAKIDANTSTEFVSRNDREVVLAKLKSEACDLGADALVLKSLENGNWFSGKDGTGTAIAIKYE
jgi:hypothetical protein